MKKNVLLAKSSYGNDTLWLCQRQSIGQNFPISVLPTTILASGNSCFICRRSSKLFGLIHVSFRPLQALDEAKSITCTQEILIPIERIRMRCWVVSTSSALAAVVMDNQRFCVRLTLMRIHLLASEVPVKVGVRGIRLNYVYCICCWYWRITGCMSDGISAGRVEIYVYEHIIIHTW